MVVRTSFCDRINLADSKVRCSEWLRFLEVCFRHNDANNRANRREACKFQKSYVLRIDCFERIIYGENVEDKFCIDLI